MLADAGFIFTVCQIGAERALKRELQLTWPTFRFAYSRPGFVTFRLPDGLRLSLDFELGSTFARTHGFALGKCGSGDSRAMVSEVWKMSECVRPEHLHVWQRDSAVPGENEFEPGPTPLAEEVGRLIAEGRPNNDNGRARLPTNEVARRGQCVLDCVLVEPDEWWIGYHQATVAPLRWPGGVPPLDVPETMISRAYLKTSEALEWSGFPVKAQDLCAEIGSAPGGTSQALLDRGLVVLAIDPAEMDPTIAADSRVTHVKKRVQDVRRREFRDVRWLLADANVAPEQTLDAVEAIVGRRDVHIRGLLLTLKLLDESFAERIPEYVQRVTSWGYSQIQTRQLAFNRREVCLAASRR